MRAATTEKAYFGCNGRSYEVRVLLLVLLLLFNLYYLYYYCVCLFGLRWAAMRLSVLFLSLFLLRVHLHVCPVCLICQRVCAPVFINVTCAGQ